MEDKNKPKQRSIIDEYEKNKKQAKKNNGLAILAAVVVIIALYIAGSVEHENDKKNGTSAAHAADPLENTPRNLEMQEGNIKTVCTQAAKDHFRYDVELKDPEVTIKDKWMTIVWQARVENGMGAHVNMMVTCRTDMHDFQITTSED